MLVFDIDACFLNDGRRDVMGKELTCTLVWFLTKFCQNFLLHDTRITAALDFCFGQKFDRGLWTLNYLLTAVERTLRLRTDEPAVVDHAISLLEAMVSLQWSTTPSAYSAMVSLLWWAMRSAYSRQWWACYGGPRHQLTRDNGEPAMVGYAISLLEAMVSLLWWATPSAYSRQWRACYGGPRGPRHQLTRGNGEPAMVGHAISLLEAIVRSFHSQHC